MSEGRYEPDVQHPRLAIEVKSRQSLPKWLLEATMQATLAARAEQLPVVVLHLVGTRHGDDLVVMTLDDFRVFVQEKYELV